MNLSGDINNFSFCVLLIDLSTVFINALVFSSILMIIYSYELDFYLINRDNKLAKSLLFPNQCSQFN